MTGPAPGGPGDALIGGVVVVTPSAMVAGGDALARSPDGRVLFVEGGLPGERVAVEITDTRRDFARGRVRHVEDPSPERTVPPCRHVARGCGGCPWQYIDPDAQADLKAGIVGDALRRIARIDPHQVRLRTASTPALGYRTTVRLVAARDGRLGYRRRHSHQAVATDDCLVAHPALASLMGSCRFPGAAEVVLRCSVASGERLAVVHRRRGAGQARRRAFWVAPDGLTIVEPGDGDGDGDGNGDGELASLTERVAGRCWRVSATSFFQPGPAAAELLVAAVDRAVGDALQPGGTLLDAYAGVGILGGVVAARRQARLISVEQHQAAAADARRNLSDLEVLVECSDLTGWEPRAVDVVIADPSRSGLGTAAERLAATGASRLVLVACDPASLARDAVLLAARSFRLVAVEVLDLFPHTAHVESVAVFVR